MQGGLNAGLDAPEKGNESLLHKAQEFRAAVRWLIWLPPSQSFAFETPGRRLRLALEGRTPESPGREPHWLLPAGFLRYLQLPGRVGDR
ncbi:hypothetical protein I4F81_006591 [Pyropia yezoensis]|uniref:Uncharacterized protein n=1 Tax=Pyropia yezoensis TaxID=2788 RepID=A0ACC3C260_PYRYE|nr:hypothetical protein I4F81_006591 [Neopyropia yezoensis]